MLKVLLAADGSEGSLRTARKLIEMAGWYKEPLDVELVNVHLPLPNVGGFAGVVVSREMVQRLYSEEGGKALAPIKKLLDEAKIKYTPHVLVGDIAQSIVDHAQKTGCGMICMGARGTSTIANLVLGSIATKVLHLATVPVVLIR
jgi:nucleotide-binding universal stress UspA family protein